MAANGWARIVCLSCAPHHAITLPSVHDSLSVRYTLVHGHNKIIHSAQRADTAVPTNANGITSTAILRTLDGRKTNKKELEKELSNSNLICTGL